MPAPDVPVNEPMPRVTDLLGVDALIELDRPVEGWTDLDPGDLTRESTVFPMSRAERLQALSRGDEGFLLSLGYSTQRGFGNNHPFVGEVRVGEVEIEFDAPEIGHAVPIGRIEVTECQMVNQFVGSVDQAPQFTRGYGLAFGRAERKAMSMSLVDRALRRGPGRPRVPGSRHPLLGRSHPGHGPGRKVVQETPSTTTGRTG